MSNISLLLHDNNYYAIYLDGHFVCEGNLMGVQYYGEWRTFRIVKMQSLDSASDSSSSSPLKHPPHSDQEPPDVVHKLSELALDDGPSLAEEHAEQLSQNADVADSRLLSDEDIPVLKITARTKTIVVDASKTTKPSMPEVSDETGGVQ